MASTGRYVVLGVAPFRTEWFGSVARWSNEAAIDDTEKTLEDQVDKIGS